jgi:hypothetical protein
MPLVVAHVHFPISNAEIPVLLAHFFNDSASAAIQAADPPAAYANNFDRVAAVLRDYFFLCSTRDAIAAMAAQGLAAHMYQFVYARNGWPDYEALGTQLPPAKQLQLHCSSPPSLSSFRFPFPFSFMHAFHRRLPHL